MEREREGEWMDKGGEIEKFVREREREAEREREREGGGGGGRQTDRDVT